MEALAKFAYGIRQYLLVTTVFGFIVAVLDTIALAIMGIPLAITWGVLAFVTNYIPNVGFILGVVPPALLGLLTAWPGVGGGRHHRLLRAEPGDPVDHQAPVHRRCRRIVDDPDVRRAGGWAWLLGGLGGILAIPMTLLIKALLIDTDPKAAWANALMRSLEKVPDPNKPPKVKKSR